MRRVGGQVRVSVQLIEAASDRQLWAERFDRQLDDIFVIQQEIAELVADTLQVQLVGPATAVRRPAIEVYEMFLQARSLAQA